MTNNPCNCLTCNKYSVWGGKSYCSMGICGRAQPISYVEMHHMLKIGCLSHPQAREHLNKEIIVELERAKKHWEEDMQPNDFYENGYTRGLGAAIALIRNVVKKE